MAQQTIMNRPPVIHVDNVCYIRLSAAFKSLDEGVVNDIKSIQDLANSSISSNASATSQNSTRLDHRTGPNDIFMGLYMEHKHFPSRPPNSPESVRITMREISLAEAQAGQPGNQGKEFHLFLFSHAATQWLETSGLMSQPRGQKLILFKRVTYQTTRKGETNFRLTQSSMANGAHVWVKSFFATFGDARSERYNYKTLVEASEVEPASRSHFYAVVNDIAKAPRMTSNGKLHGILVLVDPSCYDGMTRRTDFLLHLFIAPQENFPEASAGDIVRVHRAKVEPRPLNGKLDFRCFTNKDVVVFPWQGEPRTAASRITMADEDLDKIATLRAWSVERYRQGPVATSPAPPEPKIITLAEIRPDEVFSLPCRLVKAFDEPEDVVALWVEDGTKCPLLTLVGPREFDSQYTQLITQDNGCVCIKAPKRLLPEGWKPEESEGTLLYLRWVRPQGEGFGSDPVCYQFEVTAGVELLPTAPTRYRTGLLARLAKLATQSPSPTSPRAPQLSPPISPQAPQPPASPQAPPPPAAVVVSPIGGILPSSGESATERAMREMPSPVFQSGGDAVLEDLAAEASRLGELVLQDGGDSPVAPFLLRMRPLESQEPISFSQAVTSTQKVPQDPSEPMEEEMETSEEVPNGQRLPLDSSESPESSPHPRFRAVEEVLEIRTTIQQTGLASRLDVSISSPEVEVHVSRKRRRGRSESSVAVSPSPSPQGKLARLCTVSSDDDGSSVVEIHPPPSVLHPTQDSTEEDDGSVVLLTQPSQPDLELLYRKVEEQLAGLNRYITSLSEADYVLPGQRFRVTSRIDDDLSPVAHGRSPLEGILVAICSECHRLWEHYHFKDLKSHRVRRRRKPGKTATVKAQREEEDQDVVVNYLDTTKEDHDQLMGSLRESPGALQDLKAFDWDEGEFIDRSYDFICPSCSRAGLPDSLIRLEPSFFLRIHATDLDDPTPDEDDVVGRCPGLHVMACGVHAEYLLGTRADDVLRSDVIWKKAEARLERLIKGKDPLTLSLRRLPHNPKEIHVENTYVVYGPRHIPPFSF